MSDGRGVVRRVGALVVAAGLAVLQGCASARERADAIVRTDSAGVTLVHASGAEVDLPWTFTEAWRAGGADEGPTSFTRLSNASVAAAPDGSVYVLNRDAHQIVVLDRDGRVARLLGGQGGGPGELEMPMSLVVLPDSSAWVFDYGKNGFVRYAADGTPLPVVRVRRNVTYAFARPAVGGVYLREDDYSPDSIVVYAARVTPEEARDIQTVVLPSPAMVEVPGCHVTIPLGKIFEKHLIWDGTGRRLASTLGPEYVLDVYDDGVKTMSLRRDILPAKATEEMAAAVYPDGLGISVGGPPCRASGAQMAKAQGVEDLVPVISSVAVAPDGEIWVERSRYAAERRIDVWSPSGDFVGTLPAGTRLPVAFLADGRVAFSEKDSLDVPRLVVYELRRSDR